MSSIFGSFIAGQQAGQQQHKYRQEQSKLAQLQQLAPQVLAGNPEAYGQSMALDSAHTERLQDGRMKRLGQLEGMVKLVDEARASGDPRRLAGAMHTIAPFMNTFAGVKFDPNVKWTPDFDAGWDSFKAMVTGARAGGTGDTLQSQKVGEDGFIYNTFRDGRMVNTGVRADRQMWFRDHPGMDPQLVGKDGSVQTVGMAQAGTAVAPAAAVQPQRADMEADIELANSMIAAGIPEAQVDAFLAQRGQRASTAAPVAAPAQAGYGTPAGGSLARPSPAQEAAATERAKLQAQAEYLPQELAMRGRAAVDQAVGIERGKAGIEQASAAPGAISTMEQSIAAIDALLNSPDLGSIVGSGSINPLNLIPGTAARGLIARAEQISGQAFLAAFNQLKGGGAITEKEGQAATAAMARLDRSQSLTDYQTALRDLRAAIAPALERQRAALARGQRQGGSQPARAQPAAAPVQRARNPQTGQVVEFRNGQWVPVQ